MKNKLIILLGLILFSTVIFINSVNAFESVCVKSSLTDISPSSIKVGEEFTVGIQIENCGNNIPSFVSFELLQVPKDITIKEPLVINISRLYYGNSERFITYHMRVNDDASPGTYILKTKLSYGEENSPLRSYDEISFNIIGDESELGIASVKTDPVLPVEGEQVELTVRIENVGEGIAKSVRVYADHPFLGSKQSFIGSLESEEDGPAVLTFIVDKAGEHSFPVVISYNDDFGEGEIKTNLSISVLEKPSNIVNIVLVMIFILLFGSLIYYLFKIKRSKDKIIHQLLKGTNSK